MNATEEWTLSREMLSREELRSLIRAFGDTCQFISDLRERWAVATHVQYPKIPTILSESLAVLAINDRHLLVSEGRFTRVVRGGRKADIIATVAGGRELNIETKASGESDFATFGEKDYAADFLLWLRFGNLLRENRFGQFEVLICPRPADHLPWKKTRVTVNQLTSAWDGQLESRNLDLATLLGSAPD